MAINITPRTRRALNQTNIEPNIAVRFQGLDVTFSAKAVKEFIKINDPGFFIGAQGYFIGGLIDVDPERNRTLIDDRSTSFRIQQQINHDEGRTNSISSMNVGLVDKDQYVSLLISPGQLVDDMLGRKAQIFITFGDVSFFEDSIEVFKGIVTQIDSGAGLVQFKINHPDAKKQVELFKIVETELTSGMNTTQTTLDLEDVESLILPTTGFDTYVRINAEIIQYTGISGNTLTGLTRGVLGTTATPHNQGDQARPVYSIRDNPLDLAVKLMLSGHGENPVYDDIPISSFRQIGASNQNIANAIYFDSLNIIQDFGVRIGDTVSVRDASNSANNVTERLVQDIVQTANGFYILISGANLVTETDSDAIMSLFSQYNVYPQGMRMKPDEVDIDEHIRIRDFFHSATEMQFFFKDDEIDGKEFIDEELYRPIACYALPRKAKASVGYTVGPIPGEDIVSLNSTNIKSADMSNISRQWGAGFFNEVVYKYDDTPLLDDTKFLKGQIFISAESKERIPGINRTYVIESKGLRSNLNAINIAASNSQRIIDRYKFAAETVRVKTMLGDTLPIEIGDIVVGEFADIKMTDISKGNRDFKPRFFEVLNKSLNLKTGDIDLHLLDTGLNIDARFGLMSPTSYIASVTSPTQIVIGPDPLYGGKFGDDEFLKWENLISVANPLGVIFRDRDFTTVSEAEILSINENNITLRSAPSTPVTRGMKMEFANYQSALTSIKQTLIFAYMSDVAFDVDEPQYLMI